VRGDTLASTLNIDKLFVSKIVQEKDITPVVDIPPEFLFDPKYRSAYEYIRKYYAEHGNVPTLRIMLSDCPDATLVHVDEPWSDITDRIAEKYVAGVVEQGLSEVMDHYEAGDIKTAVNFLGMLVSRVHTAVPTSRETDVTRTGDERLARYQERRDNPGTMVGIPTGFATLDRATQGLQKGQLITVTGLTKASKSTLALVIAMAVQRSGKRVAYFTYEQTCEEQERRYDAYNAGINDNLLNSGDVSSEDWRKVVDGIKDTEELPSLTFCEDVMTVTAVGAKCDIYKPDVVIIDGTYMQEDENGETKGSPQALANIVSGYKSMAMRRKICIILVTQSTPARTKGETLNNDSIMGSRAFTHYSNVVLGIERTEDTKMRKLKILMSRSCAPCEVILEWDYDTGTFQEMEGYNLEDTDQALEKMMEDEWSETAF
jgi:RecA/RadA recombinase